MSTSISVYRVSVINRPQNMFVRHIFINSNKVPISFVMSVHLSVHVSVSPHVSSAQLPLGGFS
jgi:hypothetical protein